MNDADAWNGPAQERAEESRGRSTAFVFVAVVTALAVGVGAGVFWHAPLAALVGGHGHDGHDHLTATTTTPGAKQLWTCSMHPQVIKEAPGFCPICHMALTPMKGLADENLVVARGEASAISVTIDPVVVQNMGVRVGTVTTGPVSRDVRAVGYLDEAQPNVRDVNLRVSGWVEKLYADTVGMALSKGAPLFDLYSPEMQVAAEELIAARKSLDGLGASTDPQARKTAQTLFDATRLKLEQWGLDEAQVERLAKQDRPPRTVTFASPIDGYLTQKMLVHGGAAKAGDTVLKIVDLSSVWLDSQVYAQDLPFVRLGRTVSATVDGLPGKRFEGQVIFIQPELDPQTRTATVRIALPNMELDLRPGMYAAATIHATLTDRAVLAPREAIVDTGTRQVAFVVAGAGRFEPRQVRLGADGEGGVVQVLEGLAPGETVVTSGQFLLDAESRMREAIQKHLDERLLVGAKRPAKPMPAGAPTSEPSMAAASPAVPMATTKQAMSAMAGAPGVDRVFEAYLAMQKALGATQQGDAPVDVAKLIEAARAIAKESSFARVVETAAAMQGKPIAEQRNLFKALSDAVIAVARSDPPSAAVAPKLYVAYCPMAPGDGGRWLQTTQEIANPYFATRMKECGSIEQALATAPARK